MDFYDGAINIAKFLTDAKAEDVVVLDLREANIWTDFFVIATILSPTHASGIEREMEKEIEKLGLKNHYKKRSSKQGNEWKLIDIDGIVIHLMSQMSRNFYDLESLHKNAKRIIDFK